MELKQIEFDYENAGIDYALQRLNTERDITNRFYTVYMARDLDVRLSENGVEIRRDPLSTSDSVREKGGGEFMIWNDGTILFSATDSSDPAVNGRAYAITLPKILPKRMVKIVYAAKIGRAHV